MLYTQAQLLKRPDVTHCTVRVLQQPDHKTRFPRTSPSLSADFLGLLANQIFMASTLARSVAGSPCANPRVAPASPECGGLAAPNVGVVTFLVFAVGLEIDPRLLKEGDMGEPLYPELTGDTGLELLL